ncbi:mas-related G-protein coupled receptor member X2-like [Sarcophilus harrisii]|nr:mas-related G-protein coupled receptor member X2-like [Sarcophilus harrisii]
MSLCPQGVREEQGYMERVPPAMTVSPTPEYSVYDSDNSTENSENKSSSGSLNFDDWMKILLLFIASLGLVGNGTVLWLLGSPIRRNHFAIYILNLAAADALFLCSFFLISIDDYVKYVFDDLTWTILSFLRYISYTAGLNLLAAISTERCLSALFPLWYRSHSPKHMSVVACVVLWALAGMLWLVSFVFWKYLSPQCSNFFIIEGAWYLFLTCVMCVSSLTLLLRVQCSSRRRRPPRLYLLVLLMVLVFLLCGLPWGIWDFVNFNLNINLMPSWLFDPLACVNSSVNPLIYFFVGRLGNKRRETLRVMLQRVLGDE